MKLSATTNSHAIMDGKLLARDLKKTLMVVHTPGIGYEAFVKKDFDLNNTRSSVICSCDHKQPIYG